MFLFVVRPVSARVARLHLWRPIAALGTISYSLYLVNQFNLMLVTATVNRIAPNAWESVRLGAMLGLEIAIATAFWYCCERPFLNGSSRQKAAREPMSVEPASAHPQAASS
jgi:peptidoglycan/LPS O-acetylase OafA/YrhL